MSVVLKGKKGRNHIRVFWIWKFGIAFVRNFDPAPRKE